MKPKIKITLFLILSLLTFPVFSGNMEIVGHSTSYTYNNYPDYEFTTNSITIKYLEGAWNQVVVDNSIVVQTPYPNTYTTYNLNISKYADGQRHKLEIRDQGTTKGTIYFKYFLVKNNLWFYVIKYESEAVLTKAPHGLSSVTIPESIDYEGTSYPVSWIDTYAFQGSSIESLSIPPSITNIGKGAFLGCRNLSEIILEETTKSIHLAPGSSGALFEDSPLRYVKIGRPVTFSSNISAFKDKTRLQTVILNGNITSLPNGIFSGCTKLNDLQIKAPLKTIGQDAFNGCLSLHSIELPNTLTEIGKNAFYNCSALESITSNAVNPPVCGRDAFGLIDKNECILYVPGESVDVYSKATEWEQFFFIVEKGTIPVKEIVLNKTNIELNTGDEFLLTGTVSPKNASDKTIIWTSSDNSIASVSNNGLVVAKNTGIAIITATSGKVSATCTVTVSPHQIPATSISLDKEDLKLTIGESFTLTATVNPDSTTDKTLIWKTDDENIVSVSSEGTITAISEGTTTVHVSCGEVSASCTVTVTPIFASELKLDVDNLEMVVGQSGYLTATVYPENTTHKTIIWESTQPDIVAVDETGYIQAFSPGNSVIIARIRVSDGYLEARCDITVFEDDTPGPDDAVDNINQDENKTVTVVTLDGLLLLKNAPNEELESLSPGIYIINGRKERLGGYKSK